MSSAPASTAPGHSPTAKSRPGPQQLLGFTVLVLVPAAVVGPLGATGGLLLQAGLTGPWPVKDIVANGGGVATDPASELTGTGMAQW